MHNMPGWREKREGDINPVNMDFLVILTVKSLFQPGSPAELKRICQRNDMNVKQREILSFSSTLAGTSYGT